MKVFKGVLLLVVIGLVWSTAVRIKAHRLNNLVESGKIPYGPLPLFVQDYYSYDGLYAAFNPKVDLKRSSEFSKSEFENMVLNSLDGDARINLKHHLSSTLNLSVDYQMDPFWIISIMMVESRFNPTAQSHKNAQGLMQIQPETAGHLYQLMNKKMSDEKIDDQLHKPSENIEVGVFYLKKLLHNFMLNYQLATIAYNLGPNKLKNRIANQDIDTKNFTYLNKVQESYNKITKKFIQELSKHPHPYEMTYVVRGQGNKLEERILGFYVAARSTLPENLLLTSENLVENSQNSRSF